MYNFYTIVSVLYIVCYIVFRHIDIVNMFFNSKYDIVSLHLFETIPKHPKLALSG